MRKTELLNNMLYCWTEYGLRELEDISFEDYKSMVLDEFIYEDHDAETFEEYVADLVRMYKERF